MTVPTTVRSVNYAGNGSLTVFAYPFRILDEDHLIVTLVVDSTGLGTTQTIITHYSVSGVGVESGGNITMVTAPASGETLVIERTPPVTQLLDLRNQGSFLPESLEDQLDLIVMIIQSLSAGGVVGGALDAAWPLHTEATKPLATAGTRGKPYRVQDAGGIEYGEIIYQTRTAGVFGRTRLFSPPF